jgi:hypothetical protein
VILKSSDCFNPIAWRPGQGRSIFRDPLERVASDPQLAEWFRQEQEFDAVMIEKFREVPVDDAARQRVLRAIESVKWPDRADDETP